MVQVLVTINTIISTKPKITTSGNPNGKGSKFGSTKINEPNTYSLYIWFMN